MTTHKIILAVAAASIIVPLACQPKPTSVVVRHPSAPGVAVSPESPAVQMYRVTLRPTSNYRGQQALRAAARGRLWRASELASSAVGMDGSDPDLIYNMAVLQEALGRDQDAIVNYGWVIKFSGDKDGQAAAGIVRLTGMDRAGQAATPATSVAE